MSISIPSLGRYSKKNAQKVKRLGSDPLSIDLSEIVPASTSLAVVRSRKDYKRSLKSDYGFVLNQRNNQLVYNQNGSDKGFGKGGVIVRFKKNLLVDETSFVLNSDVSSDGSATDAPSSDEPPPVVNESGVSTGTGASSGSGATQSPARSPAPVASSLSQETIYGEISYRGEEDLYELDVPTGHQVFLTTTGDVQSYVLVVDADGNELARGGVFDTTTYVKGDEDIYAKVIAYGGQTGDYEFQFDSDLSDALKRQSAPSLKRKPPTGSLEYKYGTYYIEMDDEREGEIEYEGERDFYKLNVSPGNVVSLTLNSVEDGVYPDVSIVNSNGDILKEGLLKGGDYEVYMDESGSGLETSSSFCGLGPYDVVTGQTDLYAMVELSGGTGFYSLTYEIHESPADILDTITSLVNEERSKVGASTLVRNSALDRASYDHSNNMLEYSFQSHTGFDGSSPSTRAQRQGHEGYVGENIHTTHSAFGAMQAWMNSYGHRQNLLNTDHVEMGVGFDSSNELDNGKWTQLFA